MFHSRGTRPLFFLGQDGAVKNERSGVVESVFNDRVADDDGEDDDDDGKRAAMMIMRASGRADDDKCARFVCVPYRKGEKREKNAPASRSPPSRWVADGLSEGHFRRRIITRRPCFPPPDQATTQRPRAAKVSHYPPVPPRSLRAKMCRFLTC